MFNSTLISHIADRDLAVVRHELQEACDELGAQLGLALSFVGADARRALYLSNEGLVTAKYKLDEDSIEFSDIDVSSVALQEHIDGTVERMVEAILSGDEATATNAFNEVSQACIQKLNTTEKAALIESRMISEGLLVSENNNVRPANIPRIDHTGHYFRHDNFETLSNLPTVREALAKIAENTVEDDGVIAEASRWSARGGKRPRKVKIDRKKKRIMRRYARKNRARLIKNLKKARKRLRKLSSKASFRRRVAKVRKLNDALDREALGTALAEAAAYDPAIAYTTKAEMARVVSEALQQEGITDSTEAFINETADALVTLARTYEPKAKTHIIEAAMIYIPKDMDMGTDNLDEVVEIANSRLWEAVEKEDSDAVSAAKNVKDMLNGLIEEIEADVTEEEDPEMKEIKEVLKLLKNYHGTLSDFDKNPDDLDVEKVLDIVDDLMSLFAFEDDDPESEKSSDEESEDDESDEESEDDESESGDESDEDNSKNVNEAAKKNAIKLTVFRGVVEVDNVPSGVKLIVLDRDARELGDEFRDVYGDEDSKTIVRVTVEGGVASVTSNPKNIPVDIDDQDDINEAMRHEGYSVLLEPTPHIKTIIDGKVYSANLSIVIESGKIFSADGAEHVLSDEALAWAEGCQDQTIVPKKKIADEPAVEPPKPVTEAKDDDDEYDAWIDKFDPQKNTVTENAPFDGCMYETHGKDLDFVEETYKSAPNTVWTIVENDESMTILPGMHRVNRFGFFITKNPWTDKDKEYKIDTEVDEALQLESKAHGFKDIAAGDRVTISTPHGGKLSGRVVMRSSHGGWVLNLGGRHGTPGLVDEKNFISVRKAADKQNAFARLGGNRPHDVPKVESADPVAAPAAEPVAKDDDDSQESKKKD